MKKKVKNNGDDIINDSVDFRLYSSAGNGRVSGSRKYRINMDAEA